MHWTFSLRQTCLRDLIPPRLDHLRMKENSPPFVRNPSHAEKKKHTTPWLVGRSHLFWSHFFPRAHSPGRWSFCIFLFKVTNISISLASCLSFISFYQHSYKNIWTGCECKIWQLLICEHKISAKYYTNARWIQGNRTTVRASNTRVPEYCYLPGSFDDRTGLCSSWVAEPCFELCLRLKSSQLPPAPSLVHIWGGAKNS